MATRIQGPYTLARTVYDPHHILQSLTVLDYLLHAGSENVVVYFRDNIYIIKTLKEFQYIDEEGKDQGANVRQKAKDITNLLQDESRLRHERRDLRGSKCLFFFFMNFVTTIDISRRLKIPSAAPSTLIY